MKTKPSQRSLPGMVPSDDVIDTMLVLHGINATLHAVLFHNIQQGDRLILGDLANAALGRGPCGDVAATSGAKGHLKTRGGLTVQVSGEGLAYVWVVEVDEP